MGAPANASDRRWTNRTNFAAIASLVRATAADADPLVAQRCPRRPPGLAPRPSSSGTKTSLKNTSLNSESPVICRSGRLGTEIAHVDDHRGDTSVFKGIRIGIR